MEIIVSVLLLAVLGEGILLVRVRRENQMLLGMSAQVESLRSELARAAEGADQREHGWQALKEELAGLHDELDRSKTALNALALGEAKQPAPSKTEEGFPLGLTTNDVDLAGMLIRGTNTVGTLFVPLVGKCLERVRAIRDKRQPLIFGWLISSGDPAVWGQRDGTNVGLALRFSSAAKAEAVAAKMRELGG